MVGVPKFEINQGTSRMSGIQKVVYRRSRLKNKIKTTSYNLINSNYYLLTGVPVLSTDFSGILEADFASIFPLIFKEIGETVAFE